MKSLARLFSLLIVIIATIIVAYTIGRKKGEAESQTALIQNVAFVRDIAELASVEVTGNTTYRSSNIAEDASGFSAALRKAFLEKTISITSPYTAKYGIDLTAQNFHIQHLDTGIVVHLPHARLLSFELRLDRIETSAQKGALLFEDDDFYTSFEKKMYAQTRNQLETNTLYLKRAEEKVCGLMQRYFGVLGLEVRCVFENDQRPLD
jgi:hypothetical protein